MTTARKNMENTNDVDAVGIESTALFAFDSERDWNGGSYQEKCHGCGKLFFGRKDAPFCRPCSKANDEWWDSLTDDQQLEHMRKIAEAYRASKANSQDRSRPSPATDSPPAT